MPQYEVFDFAIGKKVLGGIIAQHPVFLTPSRNYGQGSGGLGWTKIGSTVIVTLTLPEPHNTRVLLGSPSPSGSVLLNLS